MSNTAGQSGFRFFSETFSQATAATAKETLIAAIPAGVNSKTQLLQLLSRELQFPSYFGWNWDALSDCLRDFHWLEQVRRVRIIHETLPFPAGWKKQRLYLGLLQTAIDAWNSRKEIQLEVLFPESLKRTVQQLLTGTSDT